MTRHETFRWTCHRWTFTLAAGGSYIVVRDGAAGTVAPYDMAARPPVSRTTRFTFEVACVRWLVEHSPLPETRGR